MLRRDCSSRSRGLDPIDARVWERSSEGLAIIVLPGAQASSVNFNGSANIGEVTILAELRTARGEITLPGRDRYRALVRHLHGRLIATSSTGDLSPEETREVLDDLGLVYLDLRDETLLEHCRNHTSHPALAAPSGRGPRVPRHLPVRLGAVKMWLFSSGAEQNTTLPSVPPLSVCNPPAMGR